MAKAAKRKSSDDSIKTRAAILDATAAIMREEGYAAVSSRRVGEKAGLKSKLVHYYFKTMDELFAAVYARTEAEYLQRLSQALESANPLQALWNLSVHPKRTTISLEFIALSNHRKTIRKQLAHTLEQMHKAQIAVLTKYIETAGLDTDEFPPTILSYIIYGMGRSLVTETALGVTTRHPEVLAYAERWLRRMKSKRGARGTAKK